MSTNGPQNKGHSDLRSKVDLKGTLSSKLTGEMPRLGKMSVKFLALGNGFK
jgi:hypothetical protein